ncbi:MAG: hypothetical protein M1431_06015 [Candidatus Thermoplasmatota archaeon]|nr:hypothetical protein [Candidatus Thermoplasmatota archaeon]
MARIGVLTSDFKFYHDVIELLKSWELPFVSLSESSFQPPDVNVVLSSSRDSFQANNQFKGDTPLDALRSSLASLFSKERFTTLTIGIDPGPYPGVAVFADDILMEAFECPSRDDLSRHVSKIVNSYSFQNLQVKIGNGDAPNRDFIIKSLLALKLNIQIVDEKNTSFPHKIHDNALSAARIAITERRYVLSSPFSNVSRKNMFEREFKTLKSQMRNSSNL